MIYGSYAAEVGSTKEELVKLLDLKVEKIFASPFFDALGNGLTEGQWCLYAKQFHITCNSFDRLLHAVAHNAVIIEDNALIENLDANLKDELGKVGPNDISHRDLRESFFLAIGLASDDLSGDETKHKISVLRATLNHERLVNRIISGNCVFEQLGAFLAQERLAAGDGFWILAEGVKKSFPLMLERDSKSMDYVYQHIEFDSLQHFPNLLHSVAEIVVRRDCMSNVVAGVQLMMEAELELYDSFWRDILGNT